jgi:hypothetical protein
MLYNLLLQGQLVSPSRCTTCNFIVKDTGTRCLYPPFFHKVELHVFKGENKFSEIQLCGKRGFNREKGGPDTRI